MGKLQKGICCFILAGTNQWKAGGVLQTSAQGPRTPVGSTKCQTGWAAEAWPTTSAWHWLLAAAGQEKKGSLGGAEQTTQALQSKLKIAANCVFSRFFLRCECWCGIFLWLLQQLENAEVTDQLHREQRKCQDLQRQSDVERNENQKLQQSVRTLKVQMADQQELLEMLQAENRSIRVGWDCCAGWIKRNTWAHGQHVYFLMIHDWWTWLLSFALQAHSIGNERSLDSMQMPGTVEGMRTEILLLRQQVFWTSLC